MEAVMSGPAPQSATISATGADNDIREKLEAVLTDYPSLKAVFGVWGNNPAIGERIFSATDRNILAQRGLWEGDAPAAGVWEALDNLQHLRR